MVGVFEAPGCVPGTLLLPSLFTCDPLSLSSHTSISFPTQWDRILLVAMTFGLSYSVMHADRLGQLYLSLQVEQHWNTKEDLVGSPDAPHIFRRKLRGAELKLVIYHLTHFVLAQKLF